MSRRHHLIAPLAAALFTGSAALAETTTAPVTPDTTFILGGGANYAFDADLHDNGGSFSVFRSDASVTMKNVLSESSNFSITLGGEYSHYFFRNIAAAPGSDGSDSLDVYQFDIRPTYTKYFNDHLAAFGGLTITAAGMSQADFGDSIAYGVFGGVNYRLASGLWVGAGVGVTTQLEDNPFFVPIFTLNWQATPDLLVASDGLGIKATYKLDEGWSIYARARYEFRQFRLDGNEVIDNGVLTDQSAPLTVGVTYDTGDGLKVSADAGVVAYRRLDFTESNGHQAGADESDPAAFLSFNVTYSF